MEYSPVPTKQFMSRFDRVEPLILDSTAVTEYKDCARRYFFKIVLGFTPKETAIYFTFGTAYHKFREELELTKGDFMAGVRRGLAHWDKVQGDDPPVGSGKWEFMTRLRLLQSMKVGFDYQQKEKAQKNIEVLSVEQPFNVELVAGSGHYTSGRFDQIIRWNGKIWGRDFKTTSKPLAYYDRGITPNDQFTRYTYAESLLAGERVQGQLIEVLYNSAGTKKAKGLDGGPIIKPFVASRTDFELADWLDDELFLRDQIQNSREKDRWPKNEKACGFCPFHSVCKLGSEASQMNKLTAEFTQREWDNTKVGVDDV
jgi:hypothetical protein